jgi:hypothetical protein
MSNSCKDCQQIIDWNSKAREKLNTRRPLNPDGTIHSCNIGSRPSSSKPIPEPNNYPNPITTPVKTENAAAAKWVRSITDSKLDNLAVVKAIAAALNEYIQIKEAGQ